MVLSFYFRAIKSVKKTKTSLSKYVQRILFGTCPLQIKIKLADEILSSENNDSEM